MLTRSELGAAIAAALEQNGKTQADAARFFGVKAPSVSGWIKTGRISKDKLDKLRAWLHQTPQDHWAAVSPPISPPLLMDDSQVEPLNMTIQQLGEIIVLFNRLDAKGRDSILRSLRSAANAYPATPAHNKRQTR